MSRTSETPASESSDIRCSCGKCLAKDGEVKCPRCDALTPVRPRMLDEARHTAFYLSALATSAQLLRSDEPPVKITLTKTQFALGYVQYQPTGDRLMVTADEMKKKLVVLLAGLAAEHALGEPTTGSSHTAQQAMQLARCIVSYGMVDGWGKDPDSAARQLIESAMEEATRFVAAHRAVIDSVAAELLYKGELSNDDIARLVPVGVNDTGGGAASAQA